EPTLLAIGLMADEGDRVAEGSSRGGGHENIPAALFPRLAHGAPRDHAAPIGGGELGIHPDLAQPLGEKLIGGVEDREIRGLKDDDRTTVVACLLEKLRGLLLVRR